MTAADESHELREKIETVRRELNELTWTLGLQEAQVLEKSRELDHLLNDYHQKRGYCDRKF